MSLAFKKASKREAKLRLALIGPTGSGKTYSALALATGLGERIAVIDTERGSASKYADRFSAFDVLELESFAPAQYAEALELAAHERYDVVIVDSLSHAWMGKDGALEQVDRAAKRSAGNSFTAWRDVTPQHNQLVDALLRCPAHLIVTMRSKTEYVLEEDARGKKVPKKVGMAPVQRDGVEYEFDVVAEMNVDHDLCVTKTRMPELDGAVVRNPGRALGSKILLWTRGEKVEPEAPKPPQPNGNGNGNGNQPSSVPRFLISWKNHGGKWADKPLADAPAEVVGEYIKSCADALKNANINPDSKRRLETSLVQAEAFMRTLLDVEQPPAAADPIASGLQKQVDGPNPGAEDDTNESWGLTPA